MSHSSSEIYDYKCPNCGMMHFQESGNGAVLICIGCRKTFLEKDLMEYMRLKQLGKI